MRIPFLILLISIFCNVNGQTKKVKVITNLGEMTFMLYDDTPNHRDGFLELVNEKYFNGTLFYRVIQGFVIQGGSKDSKNAYPGKVIGYGDPDKTVNDEILDHRFCKKGALCAPRQPDELNPFKQSDISQFFVIQGRKYREGQLDTMELAVNRPIRKKIVNEIFTQEKRAELKILKEEKRMDEARDLASNIKDAIEASYNLSTNLLNFSEDQRKAYTSLGGCPELDNEFTVFGEMIRGFEVIDAIARLKTDENDRPFTDVKIHVEEID